MNMNKKIDLKRQQMIFICVLALAVLIRLIRFGSLPYGVNQDEAMGAVDAWALSLYGTDRFGVSYPVHFSAWQVSQMSVLLSYCMIPFIKIFGFQTWVIRIPMLLASIGGVLLMYLVGKELFGEKFGLISMALTAVNPWHFMQSRWSIDCNLFPHVFLLAFYLLLKGLKRRRYLYLSMLVFGLTFYCYGIAVYSVSAFLAVYAIWGLWTKRFKISEILISICLFSIVTLPEILVMAINLLHLNTMHLGPITMSRFPESVRGNDILFLNFSLGQLGRNVWALLRSTILQLPDYWFNTIPYFGPMYHISIPFMLVGGFMLTRNLFRMENPVAQEKEDTDATAKKLALWGFLVTGIWVGIITYEVNVNRINLIFYPLILVTVYGLVWLGNKRKVILQASMVIFALCGVLFLGTYFAVYPKESAIYYNGEFLEAVKELDAYEEPLYVTGNMGWQFNLSMAEILTQYSCKIDAEYYQGKTNKTGGRELAIYGERYHFINVKLLDWEKCDRSGKYLICEKELEEIPGNYQVIKQVGQFVILEF